MGGSAPRGDLQRAGSIRLVLAIRTPASRSRGSNSSIMAGDDRADTSVLRGKHWLTRVLFLRCLGFVYMVAFFVALKDNGALVSHTAFSGSRVGECSSTRLVCTRCLCFEVGSRSL